jgi:hypothetical protein
MKTTVVKIARWLLWAYVVAYGRRAAAIAYTANLFSAVYFYVLLDDPAKPFRGYFELLAVVNGYALGAVLYEKVVEPHCRRGRRDVGDGENEAEHETCAGGILLKRTVATERDPLRC